VSATQVDHLVVAARTLDEGAAWCEATLGVTPQPGGKHPLMGTHNRLLHIASAPFERAYLEIIAIDPEAPAPGRTRWFDLDDTPLQAALTQRGPQLIHWVARCHDLRAQLVSLAALGIDRGEAVRAERGTLRWQISVRPDGQRLCDGALPTLIEWGEHHPCEQLAASNVQLQSLRVEGLPAGAEQALLTAGVIHAPGPFGGIEATLSTPRGTVQLRSLEPLNRLP